MPPFDWKTMYFESNETFYEIDFFLVAKQTASHNNFGMSKRFEKLSYFLSSAPFYVHTLEKQSMECRFWQAELLYRPEDNTQFKKHGKENEKLLGVIKEIGSEVLHQSCLHLQETHFSRGDCRLDFQRRSWKVCAETLLRSNRIYAFIYPLTALKIWPHM